MTRKEYLFIRKQILDNHSVRVEGTILLLSMTLSLFLSGVWAEIRKYQELSLFLIILGCISTVSSFIATKDIQDKRKPHLKKLDELWKKGISLDEALDELGFIPKKEEEKKETSKQ